LKIETPLKRHFEIRESPLR